MNEQYPLLLVAGLFSLVSWSYLVPGAHDPKWTILQQINNKLATYVRKWNRDSFVHFTTSTAPDYYNTLVTQVVLK